MKPHPEMVEGLEAFDRFQRALKPLLTIPESAVRIHSERATNESQPQAKMVLRGQIFRLVWYSGCGESLNKCPA
jgi:hypothetical protein